MRSKLFFNSLLLLVQLSASPQSLPDYIAAGLTNNIVLKEKSISLNKALLALKESQSLFLPTTYLESQYTFAKGGRTIDMPVGDLLNPVYKTLNQMTGSKFPQINNFSEQFYPDNFYDIHIKTVMPIVNPGLKIGNAINRQKITIEENDIVIYKRELLKDIKVAYYNFLMASAAIGIYDNALLAANQNLRGTESSYKNGKGLRAYVIRASLEVNSLEARQKIARYERDKARSYFNFLLNRPLTDTVVAGMSEMEIGLLQHMAAADAHPSSREELKSLAAATEINQNLLRLNNSFRTPRVNAFVDIGAQDFDLKVNNRSLFYLAGIQVQFPIYTGKRNRYKITQAEMDGEKLSLEQQQVSNQLTMQISISQNNFKAALENYHLYTNQVNQAKNYFNLISHGYREGVNSFLEYLDASTQLNNAQLQLNISQFHFLSAAADLERQTASYSFK